MSQNATSVFGACAGRFLIRRMIPMTMSIAMANGMNALISVNSQLDTLQTEATTGKKINSASDGLAAYLSAQGYTQRSQRLSSINDTLTTNMQTIKAAQTGLSSIRQTISDTLDTLKAASQTQSYVAATNQSDNATASTAGTQIGFNFGLQNANQNAVNNVAITTASNLINTNAIGAAVTVNGQRLAQGQVFTINGYSFRIAGPGDTTNGDGTSVANAKNVFTIGDFIGAVQTAFGNNGSSTTIANGQNLNAAMVNNAALTHIVVTDNNQASPSSNVVTISQAPNTAANANIQALFAGNRAKPANVAGNYSSDDQSAIVNGQFTITGNDHSVSGGVNGQAADPRRAAAAKSYKLAMDQINQYLKNASVSGTNLLNGDALKLTFDEKGNSSSFQVQDSNGNAMQFSAAGLGLVNTATGTSVDSTLNFNNNDDAGGAIDPTTGNTVGLNNAISKLTTALGTLSLGDAQVAQFQSTAQNRVDFNTSIIGLLNDSANSLTAADMSQVSAQYAALQVQQGFAQTILANTKQSDQSVLQLLR
jgi:flagellin